ncbi:MAG: hypothetical protein V3T30_00055, partial [Thermodesulfobacteriota bacterium]
MRTFSIAALIMVFIAALSLPAFSKDEVENFSSDAATMKRIREQMGMPMRDIEAGKITVIELKTLMDKGTKVLVIDTRGRGTYNLSGTKIKGAVSIPLPETEANIPD